MKQLWNWLWNSSMDVGTLMFIVILMVGGILWWSMWPSYEINQALSANLTYKSVESTGGIFGSAEYYLFDIDGNRYKVTQEVFDAVDVPRQ